MFKLEILHKAPTSDDKLGVPKKQEEKVPETEHSLENMEKQKLLAFRFLEQTESGRLAEYITGLRPDDPKMVERLIEDQKIIRAKYNLPNKHIQFDTPTEYEILLRDIAQKNNVEIRSTSECGTFFQENSAGGVYFGDSNNIGLDLKRNERSSYEKSLGALEHELVHSEQQARYPDMPTELMEYEAYLAANINVEKFKEHPEDIEPILFSFFIGGSTRFWYKDINKENAKKSLPEIKPIWNDPEYFLKNIDNISQNEIDEYKKSNKDKISFKYSIRSEGDAVLISSRNRDIQQAIEKALQVYIKLTKDTQITENKQVEIIEMLKNGKNITLDKINIHMAGKDVLVINLNEKDPEPNRILMKEAIGY